MGEEIGERGSRKSPDGFCCYFLGFGAIPTVGTEESIKNYPEPSTQIPKRPTYHPIEALNIKVTYCNVRNKRGGYLLSQGEIDGR